MWKDVIGYEGLYTISDRGEIRNKKGEIRKINVAKNGYYVVDLYKNNIRHTYLVHRLVAQVFLPNPDNLEIINHKNGIKTDNRIDNLEWCDYSYNLIHAMHNGLRRPKHDLCSLLSEQEVREIPKMVSWGLSKAEISRYLKVPLTTIKHIFRGDCWNDIGINFKAMSVRRKNRWEKDIKLPEKYVEYLKYLKSKYRVNSEVNSSE